MSLYRSLRCAVFGVALVASACSATNPEKIGAVESEEPSGAQVFRMAVVDLDTINPDAVTPADAELTFAVDLLFDSLVDFDRSIGTVRGGVASEWATDDGKTWNFTIGGDRTFGDESDVTAEDVVASLTHSASLPATTVAGADLGAIAGVDDFRAGASPTISGLATLGPDAVQVVLDEVNYELPALLANPALAIRPAGSVAGDDESGVAAVGSGPYRLVESDEVDFSFERARPGKGLDRIELVKADSRAEAGAMIAAGDVDAAPHQFGEEPTAGASVVSVPSGIVYLAFNAVDGSMATGEARSAVAGALDRGAMATDFSGRKVPQRNSLVPGGWWAPEECEVSCSFDLDAAQAAMAGVWPDGVPTIYLDADLSGVSSALIDQVAQQLEAVGYSVEQRRGSAADVSMQVAVGNHDVVIVPTFSAVPTPYPTLTSVFSSFGRSNVSGLQSADLDEALNAARMMADDDARRDAFRSAERQAMTAYSVVPLVAVGPAYEVSDDVLGVDPILGMLLDPQTVGMRN